MASGAPEYHEHFLTRVLRLGDEAVDRVMGLWREGDALRELVARVRGDAGRALERPIAVAVDDAGRTAHVIVALDGGLVTVLSADMAVTDVEAIVPWADFEEARGRVGARRDADARKDELRRRWGWRTVWHRIQSGPHPGREVIERALADPEVLRAILPRSLEGLREEYQRRVLRHARLRFMEGEDYRRLIFGQQSLVHAARLAGAAMVTECGHTLTLLTLEPYPAVAASAAGAIARIADEHLGAYKRLARDRAAGRDDRLLGVLQVGLAWAAREKRAAETMKVLTSLARDEPDGPVGATARWFIARYERVPFAELPPLPTDPEDWPVTVPLAVNELAVDMPEHYLPEEQALEARRAMEDKIASVGRHRLEGRVASVRSQATTGRNDPLPLRQRPQVQALLRGVKRPVRRPGRCRPERPRSAPRPQGGRGVGVRGVGHVRAHNRSEGSPRSSNRPSSRFRAGPIASVSTRWDGKRGWATRPDSVSAADRICCG